MSKNIFVFVVCGNREHLDTLHFSLNYLKKYSKNEIYVLTDKNRNEISIQHDFVIDVKTPKSYDHHQASIYLKTGIHRFLPSGNNYCYLDTDVIALSSDCDNIFEEFISPILFAPDHCKVRKFSPYAVNCNCAEIWGSSRTAFNSVLESSDKNKLIKDPYLVEKSKELQSVFDIIKKSWMRKAITAIRYFSSLSRFDLNEQFYFDKKKRTWHLSTGEIVLYEVEIAKIEKETGFQYNKWNQKWYNENGIDIWLDECKHLIENIEKAFNIEIKNENWQHWNGGVFLFNDLSHKFLEAWHEKTMKIFQLPDWKTRDQGTLIATAWEFGLQNHSTLNKKWNLIADYNNPSLKWVEKGVVQLDFNEFVKPALIHVYHHFGDREWGFWNDIVDE